LKSNILFWYTLKVLKYHINYSVKELFMNKSKEIITEIKKIFVGKDQILARVLTAILAGGHILLEDIPGVGKTTMALAFSKALALEYNRMQFTPDVLPSDIVGFSVFNKNTNEMEYKKGAIICNLFLADELNRATSRTQALCLRQWRKTSHGRWDIHPCQSPSWS
jgi:MoxR-like ATPase